MASSWDNHRNAKPASRYERLSASLLKENRRRADAKATREYADDVDSMRRHGGRQTFS
jgi:hypothetical protein